MAKTAFVYHPEFLAHQTGRGHPESPQRLEAILRQIEAGGLMERMVRLSPLEAPVEAINRVHAPDYVASISALSEEGHLFRVDSDTIGSPATYRAARLAAGAVLAAAAGVMAGDVSNAFCAVRPPGHHAERDRAMGFCFFNNVAIGARYLQDRHGVQRVAIIDWDIHHGNGTQHAFYDDPSVFYFSIHQFPHYPGSGTRAERGEGRGRGFTLNTPVAAGATDADYIRAFQEELRPALAAFRPEFILISAGFDAHQDDPLSGTFVSEAGFAELTRIVMRIAAEHAGERIVSVLEGGYSLTAMPASVEAHLRALMGDEPT